MTESHMGDFLDIWHFYEDCLVFGDGSLGYGFHLKGKDISCETVSQINSFNQALESMISSIEEGTRMQVLYRLTPHVDDLIQGHLGLCNSSNENYKEILESRRRFLEKNKKSGCYFQPEIYLFLRGRPLSLKNRPLFSKEKKFIQITDEIFKTHFKNFEKQVHQIHSSLSSLGLLKSSIKGSEWFSLLYEHFNLSRSEKLKAPILTQPKTLGPQSLVSQFCLTDIHLYDKFLEIGKYKFKTINLRTLPEETFSGLIYGLLKLPFYCWISQSMKMCNQSQEYKKLNIKRKLNHSMAAGSSNVSDLESESNLNHIQGLMSELLDSTQKIVESDLNIIIWDENERQLEDKENEVLRHLKQALNGAEGIVETYANFDAFIKLAPGMCQINRPKKMKSQNLAHLLPVYSYWKGNSRPVCLIPNRDNELVCIDPFSPELPNWNGFIIGSSGSGKSFALNSLILMFIGDQKNESK